MSDIKLVLGAVILLICGVQIGSIHTLDRMEKLIDRNYDNGIQYEKELCDSSEPNDIPCATVFVKYHEVIQYEKELCDRSEQIDVPCATVFVK